jgi:hypothetical protein
MIRIYADFNSSDAQGRVMLNTVGSLRDLEKHKDMVAEGLKVILYMPNDFEVVGTITFDKIWMGVPDWSTVRYEDRAKAPK